MRNKVQSFVDDKSNRIIITRYLKSIIYYEKKNLYIKKFQIENKNDLNGTLSDLLNKIIISKNKSIEILSYSIMMSADNSTYFIHYYDKNTPISKLPPFLNIQIKPSINDDYRIFILCDSSNIASTSFDINKECFSIAIPFSDVIVDKIFQYLLLPSNFCKPTLQIFKNKKFIAIQSKEEISGIEVPLFAFWNHLQFNKIKKNIINHIVDSQL